jgi:hypothetical protein
VVLKGDVPRTREMEWEIISLLLSPGIPSHELLE